MIHRGTHLSERDGCKPAETINYGLADNVERYPLAEQHAAKKALSSVRGCGLVASHMHAHVIGVMRWAETFVEIWQPQKRGKRFVRPVDLWIRLKIRVGFLPSRGDVSLVR